MLSPEKLLAEKKLKGEECTVNSGSQDIDGIFTLRSQKG